MFRLALRLLVLVLVLAVFGVLVVALLGGAFRFGVGVAGCPAGVGSGAGPVPAWLRGGYEVAVVFQVGEFVVEWAGRVVIERDALMVRLAGC